MPTNDGFPWFQSGAKSISFIHSLCVLGRGPQDPPTPAPRRSTKLQARLVINRETFNQQNVCVCVPTYAIITRRAKRNAPKNPKAQFVERNLFILERGGGCHTKSRKGTLHVRLAQRKGTQNRLNAQPTSPYSGDGSHGPGQNTQKAACVCVCVCCVFPFLHFSTKNIHRNNIPYNPPKKKERRPEKWAPPPGCFLRAAASHRAAPRPPPLPEGSPLPRPRRRSLADQIGDPRRDVPAEKGRCRKRASGQYVISMVRGLTPVTRCNHCKVLAKLSECPQRGVCAPKGERACKVAEPRNDKPLICHAGVIQLLHTLNLFGHLNDTQASCMGWMRNGAFSPIAWE